MIGVVATADTPPAVAIGAVAEAAAAAVATAMVKVAAETTVVVLHSPMGSASISSHMQQRAGGIDLRGRPSR